MRVRIGTVALAASLGVAAGLQAQGRVSPHETTKGTVGGAAVTIEYGRPSMKGRSIMGGLVPYGKVWRTGADEATTLTTDKPITIGDLAVPAGKYTLYTVPGEQEWTLVVNKQTGQWGTQYDEKQDLGRTKMKVTALPAPVEQFTIAIDGGMLKMSWERTQASVPIAAK